MGMSFDASGLKAKIALLKANAVKARQAGAVAALATAQQTIINGGNGWPEWSAAYARRIAKRPHQMLWDTGTLLRSLTPGGSDNILQDNGNGITVGSNVAYAAAQNYGNPERSLPARPFLVVNDQLEQNVTAAFFKSLLQGVS